MTLSACATYKQEIEKAHQAFHNGDYANAIKNISKTLDPNGKDRLLYYLELGLLKNLNHQYEESNRDLTHAARTAEELETIRAADLLAAMLTNPRQGSYRESTYERAYIHYYKALNYLFLADRHPTKAIDHLESARVEARKIDIMLSALEHEEGNYQEARDRKTRFFGQLMTLLNTLDNNYLDEEKLVFREDAYIRYLTGVIYESNGELDNARIAYRESAELYQDGYADQYELDHAITEQAWFDTIRVMKTSGDYEGEWQTLSNDKLPERLRNKINTLHTNSSQLIIIEHIGIIPHREELNIGLSIDEPSKSLILWPTLTGAYQERHDQFSWFYTMYADNSLLRMFTNYNARGPTGVIMGQYTKRVNMERSWQNIRKLGIHNALAEGIRVTVPYYRPYTPSFGDSSLWLNGKFKGKLIDAESLSLIAQQEQLLEARHELRKAVGRELVKVLFSNGVASGLGSLTNSDTLQSTIGMIFQIANTVTSQADTRNWLTLPSMIRIKRLHLTPGQYDVKVVSQSKNHNGHYHEYSNQIQLEKGKIHIIRTRALSSS